MSNKRSTGTPSPGSVEAVKLGCICNTKMENGVEQLYVRNDCPVHWKEILIGRIGQMQGIMIEDVKARKGRDNELASLYKALIIAAAIAVFLSFRPFG